MGPNNVQGRNQKWPTLARLPMPAKALVSIIILTMAIALAGAIGQVAHLLFGFSHFRKTAVAQIQFVFVHVIDGLVRALLETGSDLLNW